MKRQSCSTRPTLFLVVGLILCAPQLGFPEFDPPRITNILFMRNPSSLPDNLASKRTYYLNKGREANIRSGDVLNVYREKYITRNMPEPLRIFIGTLSIDVVQQGAAIGCFTLSSRVMEQPIIQYKTAMKGDIAIPRLIINTGVLFDPDQIELKPGTAQEFQKVADFVLMFSPSRLIVEGHTDSDGSREYNLALSRRRANAIKEYLIQAYGFITPNMVQAVGYGEEHPIVSNDTPENRALNRRIEVIVWE